MQADSFYRQSTFYESRRDQFGKICQGDVIRLDEGVPFIGHDGKAAIMEGHGGLWVVVGNTCDFGRDLQSVPFTQVAPLLDMTNALQREPGKVKNFRAQGMSRAFYMPEWAPAPSDRHFLADLTRLVSIHKGACISAKLEARLSRSAWVLFNCCMVRFLGSASLRRGCDIRYIQATLGHADLESTKVYLRLVPGHLREDYDAAMPALMADDGCLHTDVV